MEIRKGKLIIGKAGGTASAGSKTYKVSLPSNWVKSMNLDEDSRDLDMFFDGNSIVIRKNMTGEEFYQTYVDLGHDMHLYRYYDGEELQTTIYADFTDRRIKVTNHSECFITTAFGNNTNPGWEDFFDFLEDRCIPSERDGVDYYLSAIGVDEYDPLEIIRKTKGRMAEDNQWIEEVT